MADPTPGDNLSEPTEASALLAFERVLGEKEAREVWAQACQALGYAQPRNPLTRPQLRQVAEHLARRDGFTGVLATALRIRLDTYESLAGKRLFRRLSDED